MREFISIGFSKDNISRREMESILFPDWEKEALVLGVLLILLDKFRLRHLLSGQILSVTVHIPTRSVAWILIPQNKEYFALLTTH